jgi:hypothetical protein
MDPLHPIVPVAHNIPPVTPAPMAGPVDRDGGRNAPDPEERRRKREPAAHASVEGSDYYVDDVGHDDGGDDDSELHINVTA